MIQVAIIGTAGRGYNIKKLDKTVFDKMVKKAKKIIEKQFKLKLEDVELVSGGAAWCDHIAVELFNSNYVNKLVLHLPAKFVDGKHEEGYAGSVANGYHTLFSKKMGRDTQLDIKTAIEAGATVIDKYWGFKIRNTHVAKSDYIIAFTFWER